MATTTKTGRKQKHFEDPATGLPVVGLGRRPKDGRWRVIGTDVTFTEPDVQKAIARFRALKRGDDEPTVTLEFDAGAVLPVLSLKPTTGADGKPTHATGKVAARGREADLFRWFAEQIAERPKYVAKMTGIEWIAYGPRLKKPEPLPSLKAIEKTWWDHAKVKTPERRKVRDAWLDFIDKTGVADLADIDATVAVKYKDAVIDSGLAGKTQSHLFNRVRRVLRFVRDRAIAVEEIGRILNVLVILRASESGETCDPNPIEIEDWKSLLKKAQGDDRAMVLCMLNFAMYLQEVVRVRWDEINDGVYVGNRQKKGKVIRAAVLWPETEAALANVKRRGEYVFYSEQGLPLGVSGAGKRWRKLRKAAELSHVEANQLRDGAFTAAAEGGADPQMQNLMVGHRNPGLKDKYVKRDPRMVKPATDAVYKRFFGGQASASQG